MSDSNELFPILVPHHVLTRASVGDMGDSTTAIVCAIPWSLIAPHELGVRRNHRLGLRALARRGGLEAREAVAAIDGRHARPRTWADANATLHELMTKRA